MREGNCFQVPDLSETMTSGIPAKHVSKHGLSLMLVSMFVLQLLVPVASASGMDACYDIGTGDGTGCDTYDHADDMTPEQQDWVEGTYEFNLVSTSSISLELTWAVREFERDSLGFGSGTVVGDTLEDPDGDNLDANDGAPADLIRHYFDTSDGATTVGQKLQTEVHQAIEDALESGFGTVTSLSTAYVNSFTNSGVTTTCSSDPDGDSQAEGAGGTTCLSPRFVSKRPLRLTCWPAISTWWVRRTSIWSEPIAVCSRWGLKSTPALT